MQLRPQQAMPREDTIKVRLVATHSLRPPLAGVLGNKVMEALPPILMVLKEALTKVHLKAWLPL